MADVAPSDLMNAPPAALTPEQAGARRAELMANPEFNARIAARDSEAFAEHAKLWRIEHGMTPEPGLPHTAADVYQAQSERVMAIANAHAAALERNFDLTDRQLFEVVYQRPVQVHEKEEAEIERQKLQRDVAFMQKWRDGNRQAITRLYLLNAIKAAPVATLDQVLEWDKQHPF